MSTIDVDTDVEMTSSAAGDEGVFRGVRMHVRGTFTACQSGAAQLLLVQQGGPPATQREQSICP